MKSKIIILLTVAVIILTAVLIPRLIKPAAADNAVICAFAEANDIKLTEYPNNLVALLERNPETKDFVLTYPLKKDMDFDTSISLPEDGTVPLLLQWDERWGYKKYSGEIIALSGCGPAALSMAASYLLNDETLSPDYIADFSEKNGFVSRGNGTSWKLMSEGAELLGLSSEEIPLWEQSMADALSSGKLIICAMGKGDFTSTGHFILLTGYEDGFFSLNDPNSNERSARLWSYEELSEQIKGMWGLSAND